MKLSLDWLSEFIDLSGITAEELADRLTMSAFEVEEIQTTGQEIIGPLQVGEIIEINQHPNADKIRLTKVKIDSSGPLVDIVCGAGNIAIGQKIPVALPGAEVINRHDGSKLLIKESQIRGATSRGMLCSASELGIESTNGDGIYILDPATTLGTDVKELLELFQDKVLVVEPRSNRGDAMSVLGMAREVSAILKRPLKLPEFILPIERDDNAIIASIDDADDCPFLSLITIRDIHVKQSPRKMLRRLSSIGLRSVNNVVDITNYVLHELGQPLHAYDLDKIKGNKLTARKAKDNELFKAIDGKVRNLNNEILVIADSQCVLGAAGIMGGQDSEISADTKHIVLEAAAFTSSRIRRGSRILGLSSDSSIRFERSVDRGFVENSINHAASLILKYCGGKLSKPSTCGSGSVNEQIVSLRPQQIERCIEVNLSNKEIEDLLKPLSIIKTKEDSSIIHFSIPSWRQKDIHREIDLIEELARLHGYDKIKPSLPKSFVTPKRRDLRIALVREILTGYGLSETWISSLTSESHDSTRSIKVLNPLSPDHQVLRTELLPGLIDACKYNQDHGFKNIGLFELGRVYKHNPEMQQIPQVEEELRLAVIASGELSFFNWHQEGSAPPTNHVDFFFLKGLACNLLNRLSIPAKNLEFQPGTNRLFHNGQCAAILHVKNPNLKHDDKANKLTPLGFIGQVHPAHSRKIDLRLKAYCLEIDLDTVFNLRQDLAFSEIANTPQVQRDLTIDLSNKHHYSEIYRTIKQCGGKILKNIDLVSIYELDAEKLSFSCRLIFQHRDETLKNEEIDKQLAKIRSELTNKLGASFRA